jgi:heat shock protein HslJ
MDPTFPPKGPRTRALRISWHYFGHRHFAETSQMNRTALTLLASAIFVVLTSEKCDKDAAPAGNAGTSNPASMIGTRWNLSTLAGEAISLPSGVEVPYLSVAEDNSLTGFGGCNRLMGSVKLEGSSLSFPGVGSTKMYCKDAQATETAFLNAMRATTTFRVDGDKLTLLGQDKELATLVKGK